MCFSSTASFTLGTVLVATGFFSIITAYRLNKNYLLIAFMPIIRIYSTSKVSFGGSLF